MEKRRIQYECQCPRCCWAGLFDDAVKEVLYPETRIDPEVAIWVCPLCGVELEDLR